MVERAGTCVVLGGTGTIGAAIARRLAHPDVALVLGYLEDRSRAERIATELGAVAREVRLVGGNITAAATLAALATAVAELGGTCEALVHSVAVTSFKPLVRVRPSQWSLILDVSARSLLDAVEALDGALAAGKGSVLAISSQGSTRWIPDYGALGPAKAALESMVRQLACELAPRGIRVNAIRAGLIESDVVARFPAGMRDAVLARTPFARLGTAAEIAAIAAFLLSREASWIVGQVIEADGGFSLT